MNSRTFEVTTVAVFDDTVPVPANCNCISFFNAGTSIVYVGAMPITPQREWTPFTANFDEYDITTYNLRFSSSGAGTTNLCVVTRKTYKSYAQS